jgi:hypothetical protein
MPVSIVEQDGRIVVGTPYHPNFPARARLLGGDWDALRHVWIFDAREDDRVRSLCREIYGTDGVVPIPDADGPGRNEFHDSPRNIKDIDRRSRAVPMVDHTARIRCLFGFFAGLAAAADLRKDRRAAPSFVGQMSGGAGLRGPLRATSGPSTVLAAVYPPTAPGERVEPESQAVEFDLVRGRNLPFQNMKDERRRSALG